MSRLRRDKPFISDVGYRDTVVAMADPTDVVTQELPIAATQTGFFGLYPAGDFRLTDGRCTDCATIPSPRWYLEHEAMGFPAPGMPLAGSARSIPPSDDGRAWHAARTDDASPEYPPLVWIAAPELVRHAHLHTDGASLDLAGTALPIDRVAKIPLNRSYYDASSTRFFASRPLTARAALATAGRFSGGARG